MIDDKFDPDESHFSDEELEAALAFVLHTSSLVDDGAAHVIQNVLEFGGFRNSTHGGAPCNLS